LKPFLLATSCSDAWSARRQLWSLTCQLRKKIKTFIVKRTMPTYVTVSFEVEAETAKEAYDKYMSGDSSTPVGPVEIGTTLKVEPIIDVKEKGE
jgi:hypothetical protein